MANTAEEPRTVWNPPMPGCYHILINEEQRLALIEVIVRTAHESAKDDMVLGLWIDMLCDLPKVEAEDPGILHSFCL